MSPSKPLFALVALLLLATTGAAATQIKKLPFTVKKSGTYVLKKSLKFKELTGAAITVEAPDVVIDLGGLVLSSTAPSDDTNDSVGVACSGDHRITVRNGVVRGFLRGVQLSTGSAGHVRVEDLVVEGCGFRGIDVQGQSVTVRFCRVRNTGFISSGVAINVWGILAQGDSVRVEGNQVHELTSAGGQTLRGIQTSASRGTTAVGNEVRSTQTLSAGIILFNGVANFATDNVVADCGTGLSFANGAPGKYRDNLTLNCATAFSGGTAVGSNS
ncbi:MAG: hypothetical protein ACF8XB_07250 [Planctomycetota bacterium JB042]